VSGPRLNAPRRAVCPCGSTIASGSLTELAKLVGSKCRACRAVLVADPPRPKGNGTNAAFGFVAGASCVD